MRRPLIGIDIGWSKKRRSCGIAVADCALPVPSARTYGKRIRAARLTLLELVALIGTWRARHAEELANAVIVMDGPLGPDGPPTQDRRVDAECSRGGFSGRSQPMRISHPSTPVFIESTYLLVRALGTPALWMGGNPPDRGLVLAETNPTVALALMVEQQDVQTLPSRRRARKLGGRLVRAKSDWYWAIGGDVAIASVLGCNDLIEESDHERIAALTCLGIAVEIAAGTSVALGDEQGVYALSARIASSWQHDVRRVGLVGVPSFRPIAARPGQEDVEFVPVQVTDRATPAGGALFEEAIDFDKGDEVDLLLCDSGGVNEKHNPWLHGMPSPVLVVTRVKPEIQIILSHGTGRKKNPDQWTVEPTANRLRDIFGSNNSGPNEPMNNPPGVLSKKNALSLPVRII